MVATTRFIPGVPDPSSRDVSAIIVALFRNDLRLKIPSLNNLPITPIEWQNLAVHAVARLVVCAPLISPPGRDLKVLAELVVYGE